MTCKLIDKKDYLKIIEDLLNGEVVGFPTDTVYGLAIVYNNENAFKKLYEIKQRSINKPISMMVSSYQEMEQVAYIDLNSKKIIQHFMPGALTVILKAKENLPSHVTFNYQTVGIRIPTNQVALDILKAIKLPLLVTSANLSNKPSLLRHKDVYQQFSQQIASLITNDALGNEASTVIDLSSKPIKLLRQGPIDFKQIQEYMEESKMKKIAIANDHGGLELKNRIKETLKEKYEFIDFGTDTTISCDYPNYAIAASEYVAQKKCDFGIIICKSGIGMSIAANKVKGVRCALVDNVENAKLCHQHNNANVIALGANDVNLDLAIKIIDAYDSVEFETRHQHRIDLITEYENK